MGFELKDIDQYAAMNSYLRPYHNKVWLKGGDNIQNPLPGVAKQNTPSFNIFKDSLNPEIWRYKDPATGHKGSLADLVMELFQLDFKSAIEKIKNDVRIFTENQDQKPKEHTSKLKDFVPVIREKWLPQEIRFWSKLGAKGDVLSKKKLNVKAMSSFSYIGKEGKSINMKCTPENPAFFYERWGKIYRPFNEYKGVKNKFFWGTEKDPDYIFGLDIIPNDYNKPILCVAGEKDAIVWVSHGIFAFCFNSESQPPSAAMLERIYTKSKLVFVLYDDDPTGLKYAEKLRSELKWPIIGERMRSDFKVWGIDGLNDTSDWFEQTYKSGKEYDGWAEGEMEHIINNPEPELEPEEVETQEQKNLLGKKITLDLPIKNSQYSFTYKDITLLKPGTFGVVVSQPSIGKTLFFEAMTAEYVRQLYCKRKAVKVDIDTFFFEINVPDGRKLLLIDTENPEDEVRVGMNRIYNRLAESIDMNNDVIVGNGFIGTEIWSQINIFKIEEKRKKLEDYLAKNDVGFLLLDGIQDYAKGINDDEEAKELVDWFRYIFSKYDITGLITIHANKNSEVPAGALGSYLCKWSRFVMLMKKDEGTENKIITTEFAQGKISKDDQEINQCFVYDREKGYTISTDRVIPEKKKNWFLAGMDYLLSEKPELTSKEVKAYFADNHNKSIASVERALKDYVELGKIDKTGRGVYVQGNRLPNESGPVSDLTANESDDIPF